MTKTKSIKQANLNEGSALSISQRIDQLNQKIEWFYSDDFSLDQAVENYQKAVLEAKLIEKNLKELQNQIEIIDRDFSQKED